MLLFPADCSKPATSVKGRAALNVADDIPYELKLNITDSEIVVVEDTSQWDTNAVILKVICLPKNGPRFLSI